MTVFIPDYRGPEKGMVAGVRQGRKDTVAKKIASRMARKIRLWLLNDSHPDSGCGIKIIDREVFLRLPFFNHMHRFMPALVRREGGVVIQAPVRHRARQQGNSKYRILDRLLVGISLFHLSLSSLENKSLSLFLQVF